jgi:hypothetical protein
MGVVKLSTAGIRNYSKTSDFLSGNLPLSLGSFDLLETTTLATSASSVTFSGLDTLAAGYQHLQIRHISRLDSAFSGGTLLFQFNGDTGSNYARHFIQGSGSSVTATAQSSVSYGDAGNSVGGAQSTGVFGAAVLDILDFSSTSKNTTTRALGGVAGSSYNSIRLVSSLWNNTAAVTSIRLYQGATDNFVSGSRFSLYGSKG